jgi:RimJ/RimL family protein N-acetyltransferase
MLIACASEAPMLTLTGSLVNLRILEAADAPALVVAATDGNLWTLPFTVVPSASTVNAYVAHALQGYEAGTVLPFAVELLDGKRIIGSTRFWKIDRENRRLEIGHTWYAASWQRTGVNTECKLLLLRYAFEELKCVRVQLTTDIRNEPSRRAILRLGAYEEGIIRNERIMPDGGKRTSVRYSIIDDEWPQVRERLSARLNAGSAA